MAEVKENAPANVAPDLKYNLSPEQVELSKRIVLNYSKNISTLVYAVCGAGKTELSYGVISYAVRKGQQVGFALPRRDVVIELYDRIKAAFPTLKVTAVYGGHTGDLTGNIIILTTHQLFRYPNYFDLLVMDEIDAFPFKGDDTLMEMYRRSLKGNCVLMTATPSKSVLEEFKKPGHDIVELRTRFHRHPIPVPISIVEPQFLMKMRIVTKLQKYRRENKPVFVFTPSIVECEELFSFLRKFVPNGDYVHSKKSTREETIKRFKNGELSYLVTTSVLERGVTVKDLQVIVMNAQNKEIYDEATLIQIAGRAGRKADAPDGEVCFLATKESEEMKNAINEIKSSNTHL
ncbi:MAG: DEAD/DEAH box helicase family protein [Bacilli bacterium]|nr:DEAD/DEAH box helicase family protein [Bacilli bacterium]